MAIFHEYTPENIRREIKQINFVLSNPADRVSQIFLEFWPAHQLQERREWLKSLLKQSQAARATA